MSFMPMDPSNPLFALLNPGMRGLGGIAQRGQSWLPPGAGFGVGGGSAQPQAPQQQPGLRGLLSNPDFALALLANSGGPQKKSFGEVLGQAGLQANQMGQQREDDAFQRQYRQAQLDQIKNKEGSQFGTVPVDKFTPESLAKFAQTKNYGDLVPVTETTKDPSEVTAYKYWASLSPQQQQDFLKLKRNVGSDYAIETINGVPTVVYKPAAGGPGVSGGTPLVTPLTNLPSQVAGVTAIKQAEASGGAVGKAEGEIVGGIMTKGTNAKSVIGMIDEADKIIDKATGSSGGALIDTAAATVGKSTEGAQAIAKLKVLQAGLMLNMPRMEGPQSDRDVQLYREAAASLGEPNVPRETKKAALQTIRTLQQKYIDRAAQPFTFPTPGQPAPASGSQNADPLGIRK